MAVTSVQISRETSNLLDDAARTSGLRKGYLADTAIRYFLDPDKNPGIAEALEQLNHIREKTLEQVLAERVSKGN
jgi:predicted transcriptional regulator